MFRFSWNCGLISFVVFVHKTEILHFYKKYIKFRKNLLLLIFIYYKIRRVKQIGVAEID